jgi:hypothetical protein
VNAILQHRQSDFRLPNSEAALRWGGRTARDLWYRSRGTTYFRAKLADLQRRYRLSGKRYGRIDGMYFDARSLDIHRLLAAGLKLQWGPREEFVRHLKVVAQKHLAVTYALNEEFGSHVIDTGRDELSRYEQSIAGQLFKTGGFFAVAERMLRESAPQARNTAPLPEELASLPDAAPAAPPAPELPGTSSSGAPSS